MASKPIRSSHATLAAYRPDRRPLRGLLSLAVDQVLTWHERARQRRQLRALSDYSLRDLGLSRADVEEEARKPFWYL